MKTLISALFLCLATGMSAAEPAKATDACCAAETKANATCCCEGKTAAEKAACCGAKADDKTAACCAGQPQPAAKEECCAVMDTSAFRKDSLFQADATFTDDAGRAFTLGALRGRPVVLTMFFASCGYACPLLVTDLQAIRGRLPADQRDRAVFVLVSFDTVRDTPAALAGYRAQRGLDGAWVLLHGGDEAVRELAALLGVKYKRESDGMFSHSNLITLLNGEGEIIHQRNGLKGGLDEAAAALSRLAASPP